jgi:sec-independent protein translocase protein TatA
MNFGFTELLIILAILIVIFGAKRLPELGRGIGSGIRNFKAATREGADKTDEHTERT